MRVFFFDTETTGIVKKGAKLSTQPYIVEFAGIVYEFEKGKEPEKIKELHWLIKPPISIPKICSDIHGITDEHVKNCNPFTEYSQQIINEITACEYIIGHNISFDLNMLYCEFLRAFKYSTLDQYTLQGLFKSKEFKEKIFCTMMSTTYVCKIPAQRGGYKWPKLSELHVFLFGMEFANAHNALADIEATAKCFIELVKRELVEVPEGLKKAL